MGFMDKIGDAKHVVDFLVAAFALLAIVLSFKPIRWLCMKVKRKIEGIFAGISAMAEISQMMPSLRRVAAMDEVLCSIRKQVMPNGGSSMSDRVDATLKSQHRTEKNVAILAGALRAHHDSDLSVGKFEADADGRFTWASASLLLWAGRGKESVLGMSWINFVSAPHRDRVRAEFERAVEEIREAVIEFDMQDAFGRTFPVRMAIKPIYYGIETLPTQWVGAITKIG